MKKNNITITPDVGSYDKKLTITAEANTGESDITTTFSITGGGITKGLNCNTKALQYDGILELNLIHLYQTSLNVDNVTTVTHFTSGSTTIFTTNNILQHSVGADKGFTIFLNTEKSNINLTDILGTNPVLIGYEYNGYEQSLLRLPINIVSYTSTVFFGVINVNQFASALTNDEIDMYNEAIYKFGQRYNIFTLFLGGKDNRTIQLSARAI